MGYPSSARGKQSAIENTNAYQQLRTLLIGISLSLFPMFSVRGARKETHTVGAFPHALFKDSKSLFIASQVLLGVETTATFVHNSCCSPTLSNGVFPLLLACDRRNCRERDGRFRLRPRLLPYLRNGAWSSESASPSVCRLEAYLIVPSYAPLLNSLLLQSNLREHLKTPQTLRK